jgi:DNA primase
LQPPGQKPRLYNTAAYFMADRVIGITEGEIDAIVTTEILGVPSMALPGAESWRGQSHIWGPIFKDFRVVLIFADGDDAGKKMAENVSRSVGWRARTIQCPDGQDVSSMIMAGEKEFLLDAVQNASD